MIPTTPEIISSIRAGQGTKISPSLPAKGNSNVSDIANLSLEELGLEARTMDHDGRGRELLPQIILEKVYLNFNLDPKADSFYELIAAKVRVPNWDYSTGLPPLYIIEKEIIESKEIYLG